ncbi:MAG: nucleoside triphosphate pyrophosphohydrolase [Motiliproteus sp.]
MIQDSSNRYQFNDLLRLMECLRDSESGCPWDQKQTLETIVPHTLDEVYEVIDTIERQDYPHLQDELGDLLFQVVFYAQICREQERFEFADIVDGLVRKLLRRHPHVFPDGTLNSFGAGSALTEAEIKRNWERIKSQERNDKDQQASTQDSVLNDISVGLPALMKAHKLQKRAASVGFDWQQLAPVLDNLDDEIKELREAIADNDQDGIADELGDLFFSCVNLARHLKQDSEQVLRQSNAKFERRFRRVEQLAQAANVDMATSSEQQLDQLWCQAKQQLTQEK